MLDRNALLGEQLEHGFEVKADDVAALSGQNRVKGIHAIRDQVGAVEAVVLLCTIQGDNYPNAWLVDHEVLKYYFSGRTIGGQKQFSPAYADNRVVLEAANDYPIFVFVRSKKGLPFQYRGRFWVETTSSDQDGAMFFILSRHEDAPPLSEVAVEDSENFPEGQQRERLHKYRERNPLVTSAAKERFLKKHGRLFCEVCGFDFAATYGSRGDGFIEAHHVTPVSELEASSSTSVEDILLICSNCHRMVHRTRPWLDRDEVRGLITGDGVS